MKTLLAYIWQHRWCRIVLSVTILLGLASLHPFGRQMVFGPKIDDIPWCVWEEHIRLAAQPGPPKVSWFSDVINKLGLPQEDIVSLRRNSSSLPVHVHLATDSDVKVRRYVLHVFSGVWLKKHGAELTPVMRQSLQDEDALCRLYAAQGIWAMTKEPELKAVVLPLVYDDDDLVRANSAHLLRDMAAHDPELWDPLLKMTGDRDPYVRGIAMQGLGHFGNRALPIVRAGFADAHWYIRRSAADACYLMKKDAAGLLPDLIALQKHPDSHTREKVQKALTEIDPNRFPAAQK